MTILIAVLVILVILVVVCVTVVIGIYNNLVRLRQEVKSSWSQIDV